jgi:hypothetical protein
VRIEYPLHLDGDCIALLENGFQAVGPEQHGVGGSGAPPGQVSS